MYVHKLSKLKHENEYVRRGIREGKGRQKRRKIRLPQLPPMKKKKSLLRTGGFTNNAV